MKKNIEGYWKLSSIIGEDVDGSEALKHSDYLNAKVGALLAHVSLMAVTTLWFLTYTKSTQINSAEFALVKIINISLAGELLAYVAVTMLCLRAIWITSPNTFSSILKHNEINFSDDDKMSAVKIFINETTIRKNAYKLAIRITAITSIAFTFSFIGKFIIYSP